MKSLKITYWITACLCLLACNKEEENPRYPNHSFYAVRKTTYSWERNSFFSNQPVSLKLESRMDYKAKSGQGRFEPIVENTVKISLDRSLVLGNDTILSGVNLLTNRTAEIELYTTSLNNEQVPDSYIIWIGKQTALWDSLNKGYYTVYIDALTESKNRIQDSTVFFVQ